MSSPCQSCGSRSVYSILSRSGSKNSLWNIDGVSIISSDYLSKEIVPKIGSRSGLEFSWCTRCGQIQGEWALENSAHSNGPKNALYERIVSASEVDTGNGNMSRYLVDSDTLVSVIKEFNFENVFINILNLGMFPVDSQIVIERINQTIMLPKVTEVLAECLEDAFEEEHFVENLKLANIEESDLLEEVRYRYPHQNIKISMTSDYLVIDNPGNMEITNVSG